MVKIICAGYPKTGTKSLTKALEVLGYNNIHDYLEHIDLHLKEYEKIVFKNQPLDIVLDRYEHFEVDCTVDMPPSFFFEEFFKRWPKAKIILTIRDEDAWFKSIKKMNHDTVKYYHWMTYFSNNALRYETFQRTLYQYMLGSKEEIPWLWKMHYRRHNEYVQQVIPTNQLLIFNVADGWEPLCKFLDKEIPDEPFPFVNAAGSKGNIIERLLSETKLVKGARRQIICTVVVGIATVGSIGYLYKNYLHEKLFNID